MPDCGSTLTPRAESIEMLSTWLCDIDRGKWASDRHSEPTPWTRRRVAADLERQVGQVPPSHCQSCGGPADRHRPAESKKPVRMGCGR